MTSRVLTAPEKIIAGCRISSGPTREQSSTAEMAMRSQPPSRSAARSAASIPSEGGGAKGLPLPDGIGEACGDAGKLGGFRPRHGPDGDVGLGDLTL